MGRELKCGRRLARRGLTLLELAISMAVLVVGLLAYARTVAQSQNAARSARETTLASEAARRMIETLKSAEFRDVFRLYNATAADDPPLPAIAPGANFAVPGLRARANDADGLPGEILFPTQLVGATLQLREDVASQLLGMPRDLNSDLAVDAANHAGDYQLLPVAVRVQWQGAGGPGQVLLQTTLGGF